MNESGFAIIGMSLRFPGAETTEQFWQNLRDGVESVSFFSDEELLASGVDAALLKDSNYVKARAILADVEQFDASFFGYSPGEAEMMDPQQRLLLEEAWKALEHAGYTADTYDGLIGVYAGVGMNTYLLNNLAAYLTTRLDPAEVYQGMLGNSHDFLTTRVSYKLNLKGPSLAVQTACSTSLVAVHQACQSLLCGECDLALAGGATIIIPQKAGYLYQEGMIMSPNGHCRAFDAQARGIVNGNGVGIVVLKRLADARSDGDSIYAIIKGTAINNDGAGKIGYTAPSVDGQTAVIAEAQAIAGIDAETITYVEAHGTGTKLGDPIEIRALTQAFRQNTQKKGFCALGSVKTNFGHLDAAAGVAGLIKTVLALQHQQIPPSLHFEHPNPQIDFENSPFYVNTTLADWKTDGFPRRAGVSSFGIGGTNAHVVVEEFDPRNVKLETRNVKSRPEQLLLISAKTASALDTATVNLTEHLKQNPKINLADVAYTLQIGRKAFDFRRLVVCQNLDDAVELLNACDPKHVLTNFQEPGERAVGFMFPGQGAQYTNMGLGLYQTEPTFRQTLDRCNEILLPYLETPLLEVLYPPTHNSQPATRNLLDETAYTQPAIFVIEYALAKLWMEWGISPQTIIGHSLGEYTAACLSGVFALEDALMLTAARGRLMQSLPTGMMLSVSLSEEEVQPLLGKGLSLAAVNAPALCVVSGLAEAVEGLQQQLEAQGTGCVRLQTSHAFHSSMMDPILEEFREKVTQVILSAPQIPWVSTVTGTWATAEDVVNPDYWTRNLRQTVRFADGIQHLLKDPAQILMEVGPGRTLSTLARRCLKEKKHSPDLLQGGNVDQVMLSSLRHPQDNQSDEHFLLTTLGKLWLEGVQIDWQGFYAYENRYRLPLPTYPFERQRYWIEAPGQKPEKQDRISSFDSQLSKKADIADWFYMPSWKRSALAQTRRTAESCSWLVFLDECGLGTQLVKELEKENQNVISVRVGSEFMQLSGQEYMLNHHQSGDYEALLHELQTLDRLPNRILYLWSVTEIDHSELNVERLNKAQALNFFSLLFLAQALGKQPKSTEIQLIVLSNNMHDVTGEEGLCPEKALLLGPCKVIPQEYSHIRCRSIDIVLPEDVGGPSARKLIDQLQTEIAAKSFDPVIAYRENRRWIQTFEPVRLEEPAEETLSLRAGGVYLITGGLGGIGLTLAEYLAKTVRAKLILTGRSAFPERQEWDQWVHSHGEENFISRKIRKVQQLEELGAEVLVISADVADREQMQTALTRALEQFDRINGVIHAAGVPGGGVIQQKTSDIVERVWTPKVRGTLVLDALLKNEQVDFFVLCSSLTSVLGGFGQVDYCSANAFLDAFAHYKVSQQRGFRICINWDTWREVGMAVEAQKQFTDSLAESRGQFKEVSHPLFSTCLVKGEQVTYISEFSVKTQWVLGEHRVMGQATLPGTAYLELARAAFEDHTGHAAVEMREVYFLFPLIVDDDQEKEIRTILTNRTGCFEFVIQSRADNNSWQEHAKGEMVAIEPKPSSFHNISVIESECNLQDVFINGQKDELVEYIEFGPRWRGDKYIKLGHNQGLAVLELPDDFSSDLRSYKLHPALLDEAAGFLAVQEEGMYLPFSYKKLRFKKPFSQKIYSYNRYAESSHRSGRATLEINTIIMDEQGTELVEIEGYTLRKITEEPSQPVPQHKPLTDAPESQNFRLAIPSPGMLETLTFQLTCSQSPGPGEVEIEVYTIGLNFKDVLLALGMGTELAGTSLNLGLECAGKIIRCGEGVTDLKVGDAVIAYTFSCFSSFVTVPASQVFSKPEHLSFEEAATIPVSFLTAYYALIRLGRLFRGERVLIHAAAGGVGMAAVQIAKWAGAEIFATAGNDEKRAYLYSLGIKYVMNSRTLDFAEEIMSFTDGRGVDLILNSLAGAFIPKGLSILAPFGRFLEIGKRDVYENKQLSLGQFEKALSFFVINICPEMPQFSSMVQEVLQHVRNHDFNPLPYRVFSAGDVAQAFQYMAQAKHIGKIVISMRNPETLRVLAELEKTQKQGQDAETIVPLSPTSYSRTSTGTVKDSTTQGVQENFQKDLLKTGITPSEGIEVFCRILRNALPQILVSTQNFLIRFKQRDTFNALHLSELSKKAGLSKSIHPRPELRNDYIAPRNETEQILVDIWQKALGIEPIGIYDDFFELGGDSLLGIQLFSRLRDAFHVDLPIGSLFEKPTVTNLAQLITTIRQKESSLAQQDLSPPDLQVEATLDAAICPEMPTESWISEPSSIFLTGATGFLGAFLLYELLHQTQADIHCLVRSANVEEGKKRIQGTLEFYSLWDESFKSRIIPVPGDLSQPRLGLSVAQFDRLANTLDVIYHNGALVNFVYSYSTLKAANVLGTQEILRLACSRNIKPVHYISTIAVFDSTGYSDKDVFYEHDLPTCDDLRNGYAQSKWVAEQLVTSAHSRGLPVCVYRPGRITGHSQTGIWNTDDFVCSMIKGCLQLESVPEMNVMIDMTPVDYVSRALVYLSKQQASLGQVFHLVNPRPLSWNDLITWVCSFGYSIQQIPYNLWQKRLTSFVAQHPQENVLQPFLSMFPESDPAIQEQGVLRFDCQKTLAGLIGTSIVCPVLDNALLHAYFSYFIQSGFLSPPP